jgi:hypothetical protein
MTPRGRRARGSVGALVSAALRLDVPSAAPPSCLGGVDPRLGHRGAPVQRPASPARRSVDRLAGAVVGVVGVESPPAVASDRSQEVEVAVAHESPAPGPSVAGAAAGDPVP